MSNWCCHRRSSKYVLPADYSVEIRGVEKSTGWCSWISRIAREAFARCSYQSICNAYTVATSGGINTALMKTAPKDESLFHQFYTPAGVQYVVRDPKLARAVLAPCRSSSEEGGIFKDTENRNVFIKHLLAHLFPDEVKAFGSEWVAEQLIITADSAHVGGLRMPFLEMLGASKIRDYRSAIDAQADRILASLSDAEKKRCNATQLVFEFAVTVVAETIIGYTATQEVYRNIVKYLDAISTHLTRSLLHIPPTPVEKAQLEEAMLGMRHLIESHMDEAVKIVGVFRSKKMSDFQVKTNLFFLYFAASETTAASLSHFLWQLGRKENKALQARLRLESISGGESEPHSLYAKAIRENLRLHPSAFVIGRQLAKDLIVTIRNSDGSVQKSARLLAGRTVIIHVYAMNRDPRRFKAPELFDIERAEGSACYPFGSGAHTCPGQFLALREIESLSSRILAQYEIETLTPEVLKQEGIFTLRIKGDVMINLRRLADAVDRDKSAFS